MPSSYTPINVVKVNYSSTKDSQEPDQMEGESSKDTSLQPTKDTPIRWASLILYLAVTTPLIFAMIILAAGGPINT